MQILDIDNLVDNLSILFFDIDNLPIISEMPIYRLSIIFFRYYRPPLILNGQSWISRALPPRFNGRAATTLCRDARDGALPLLASTVPPLTTIFAKISNGDSSSIFTINNCQPLDQNDLYLGKDSTAPPLTTIPHYHCLL